MKNSPFGKGPFPRVYVPSPLARSFQSQDITLVGVDDRSFPPMEYPRDVEAVIDVDMAVDQVAGMI